MVADNDIDYAEFVKYHEPQLKNIGLPEGAWRQVYEKLQPRLTYDFESAVNVNGGQATATKSMSAFSHVFVVPHLFSGDGGLDMFNALENDTEQPSKLYELLNLESSVPSSDREQVINFICQVSNCGKSLAEESYKRSNGDIISAINSINRLSSSEDGTSLMKALNLDKEKETVLTFEEFKSAMTENVSDHKLELMYNDYRVKKQQEIGKDGFGTTNNYKWEDDAEEQVITVTISVPPGVKRSDIISQVTSRHWTFGVRGETPLIYGSFQGTVVPDECTWYFDGSTGNVIANIQKAETEVFLWSCLIVGEEKVNEYFVTSERTRKIFSTLDLFWYRGLTYQPVTPDGVKAHAWYSPTRTVNAMAHSPKPNFKLSPFWSCYGGKILTLVWPVSNIKLGDKCTLNRVVQLYTGESETQRTARRWCCDISNRLTFKQIPDKFMAEYEALQPPHTFTTSTSVPALPEEDVAELSPDDLTKVSTKVKFSPEVKADLLSFGIQVVSDDSADNHWVCGRDSREGLLNANMFDGTLTNLIRLNQYIRTLFGKTDFWVEGYHINKELAALIADPGTSPWNKLWVVRCAENTAPNFITSNTTRISRMCENSLNYMAQPYQESVSLNGCACSLEYTVVINGTSCWASSIPAVHKARRQKDMKEHSYNPDYYIPRSDKRCISTTPWSTFMVDFSTQSSIPWPEVESKIFCIIYDLFKNFVGKNTTSHCYGLQIIITPESNVRVIGINTTPTYFPSIQHMAASWKHLYQKSSQTFSGFRKLL